MIILFGIPQWADWKTCFNKLPHTIHFLALDNINTTIDYIIEHKIELLIPCTFEQMFFIIDHTEQLSQYVKIICNKDKETIKLLDNKYEFYDYMIKNNFNKYIPKLFISNCKNKIVVHHRPKFPCIFKLNQDYGGGSSFVITDQNKLSETFKTKKINYVVQQYISDVNEYGGHFYTLNGDIKHFVIYVTINNQQHYIQHSKMIKYDKLTNGICLDEFAKIFKKLNFSGFTCVNFKYTNNKLKIFEINPRFGGTIVHNSADLTEIISICIQQ